MMKYVPIYALLMFAFCTSCKGQNKTDLPKDNVKSETKDEITSHELNTFTRNILDVDTGVVIQNSLPLGGPYIDPTGKRFGYAIFWTRVINKTVTPLEIKINFPADSFTIFPSPDSYLKLFLPPGEMTLDKESLLDYGATGLKSFMDTDLHKPTMLQRIIHPKEECLFYIGMLFRVPDNGPVRTGLVLKGQDLFYRISIAKQIESALIPCGRITFKE